MLNASTTDGELLQRVRNWREDDGWREFHRRYAPAIFAHARSSGLNHEEAEEVVQNTMLKVATYLPKFEYDRTVCRFRTWLNQIVNQRIIGVWRERRKSALPEEACVYLSDLLDGLILPADDSVPLAELQQRTLEVCLARVKAKVRADHWQVFEAYALLGMDAGTVAKRYGKTRTNVWRIRHRIVRLLRKEWKALLKEPFNK
jgi:RNA polymerase sigma-70 factor (ECF subfamily)